MNGERAELHRFPLLIIEDHGQQRQPMGALDEQTGQRLPEEVRAVADRGDDGRLGTSELYAERRSQAEPEAARVRRREVAAGPRELSESAIERILVHDRGGVV